MKKWTVSLMVILFIFLYLPHGQGQEKTKNPGELYDFSMELYRKGRCEEAIQGFLKIIQTSPSSKLVSYSQYMIGLCYLKEGKYQEAIQKLEFYLKTYPEGDRVGEAERGIQLAEDQLKEKASAPSVETNTAIKKSLSENKRIKRRICTQVFFFKEKNLEEVEKRLKELKRAGLDTIILKVFQGKGERIYKFVTPRHEEGVYFETEYAPVVEDILGKVAEIAHRNGLEIFAWIPTRYANYGLQGPPEYRCKSYNFETKKMEVAKGFNLFHPDVIKRLEGLFRDLGRYPIDGILFQDDLILKHNEDFSTEANKAFLKEFGYSPHPDLFYIDPYKSESGKYYVKAYTDHFWIWVNWKNRWLMEVAKRLMEAARASNPNLKFGINLYFETVHNPSNGVAWFSQSLSEALTKDFDYYAFMTYHRQTMKELNMDEKKIIDLMAEMARKAIKTVGDPAKVLMKVQILDWNSHEVIPKKEVDGILTEILNHGDVSLAFVPYIYQFPFYELREKWTNTGH